MKYFVLTFFFSLAALSQVEQTNVSSTLNLDDYNFSKQVIFNDASGKPTFKYGIYEYNDLAYKLAEKKELLDFFYSFSKEYRNTALMMILNNIDMEFIKKDPEVEPELVSALEMLFGLVGKEFMIKVITEEVTYDSLKSSFQALSAPAAIRIL